MKSALQRMYGNIKHEITLVFDDKPSTGVPWPEKCIFRKCRLWPWPLNPWPWKCHVDLVMSTR